jgi:hypothetical protein
MISIFMPQLDVFLLTQRHNVDRHSEITIEKERKKPKHCNG